MAEAFGIVSGAAGIVSLFSTCVECFNYIQIGLHFGRDFQTETLTLGLLQLRLSRWGESVNIYEDPQLGDPRSTNAEITLAKNTIYQILVLLGDSERLSRKYRPSIDREEDISAGLSGKSCVPNWQALDNMLRTLAKRRQKGASLVKLATWALHDKKQSAALIGDISKLIDNLENSFPASEARATLIKNEVAQVASGVWAGDTPESEPLQVLRRLSAEFDSSMEKYFAILMPTVRQTSISIRTLNSEGNAKVRNGAFVGPAWKGHVTLPTNNTGKCIGTLNAIQNSRVHNGDTYDDEDHFWD